MDYLAASGLEPQLAIPVIVVVVGALLVYVFGFQKSEEPSLEHLAVLQSTSSYKARSVSNVKQKNASFVSKPKEKPVQNGVAGHDKDRNASAKKKETAVNNKENKPPTTPKSAAASASKKVKQEVVRPADFDSGDWIQAVSRKDKKKQVKKDEPKDIPSSPKKVAENKIKEKEKETTIDHEEDTILKEAQVQVQSQTTQTTPKPTPEKKPKKVAKDVSTTTGFSAPSSQESTPVKQKQAVEKENVVEKTPPQVVAVNGVTESSKQSLEASPTKKQSISEDSPTSTETKGHVAFDEMGGDTNVDAWEEAKSRGNKKRRARKD